MVYSSLAGKALKSSISNRQTSREGSVGKTKAVVLKLECASQSAGGLVKAYF